MFYIQYDKQTKLMSSEAATFAELISQKCWKENTQLSDCMRLVDLSEITQPVPSVVPVGSVEFCEKVFGKDITPLNVPLPLRTMDFAGRQVWELDRTDLERLLPKIGKAFIKSATRCKTDYTGIYRCGDTLPDDSRYFVSTVKETPVAEWRCFVYLDSLVDVRRYNGSYAETLTQSGFSQISKMIQAMKNYYGTKLPAYVLDVGRFPDSDTLKIIEAHIFIACGLYGCEDSMLLPMLNAGAKTVLCH